jgi:IS30 family transposase
MRSKKSAGRTCIPNCIDIDQRPLIVEKKARLGDWELDTIIGAKHVGAIVSMVERRSKLTNDVSLEDLEKVEILLNYRPRKVLEFETPQEVYDKLTTEPLLVALRG